MEKDVVDVEQLAGREFQGWRLIEIIGKGADGVVYAATTDARDAAIKLFFPAALAKHGIGSASERLDLQLSLVGKKHHANLVEIFGGGEDPELGTLFLIMELVPGKSLEKLAGQIPPTAIEKLAGQLASAAQYLESLGIVHRDIKPSNIIVSGDFQTLTLLDLGIAYHVTDEDAPERLSGQEFVATLRYSPPEFVWRTEEGDTDGGWRAVTFYQIGATLHDMIMGKPIFAGHDTPRACLYDSVRDRTPELVSETVARWLVHTAQACLLKDWRQRLQFVSWASFFPPDATSTLESQQEQRIRLRQLRRDEARCAEARIAATRPAGPTREQHLWRLNNGVVLEVRTYLMDSPIFPKCSVHEERVSVREYSTQLMFEPDPSRYFEADVVFTLVLSVDAMIEEATKLTFRATANGVEVSSSVWTEMFTVETAFERCRRSFLDAVESMSST